MWGGGVRIYIDEHLPYSKLEFQNSFIPGVFESILVKIKVNKNYYRIIGNIYRPNSYPKANPNLHNKYITDILFQLSRSKEHNKCKIHLMGDFNLDLLKFELHKPTEEFIDAMFSFGLIPTITKPTRTQGNVATLIDNLFTSSISVNLTGILLNDISGFLMLPSGDPVLISSMAKTMWWSDMSFNRIPEIFTPTLEVNILSIRVAVFPCVLVGFVIVGMSPKENMASINSSVGL